MFPAVHFSLLLFSVVVSGTSGQSENNVDLKVLQGSFSVNLNPFQNEEHKSESVAETETERIDNVTGSNQSSSNLQREIILLEDQVLRKETSYTGDFVKAETSRTDEVVATERSQTNPQTRIVPRKNHSPLASSEQRSVTRDVDESSSLSEKDQILAAHSIAVASNPVKSEKSGKLLAYYTTKTKNLFATTTVSALSTCFSFVTMASQCSGRRKKRDLKRSMFEMRNTEDLHGTLGLPLDPSFEKETPSDAGRDAKQFTVWSTLFSTYRLTSTFFYPGTTVSISVLCTIGGLPATCFG